MLMKAVCPKCTHIVYIFDDTTKSALSPEVISDRGSLVGLDVKCPFHGAFCVSAPAETDNEKDIVCTCSHCMGEMKARLKREMLEKKRDMELQDEQTNFQNTFSGLI